MIPGIGSLLIGGVSVVPGSQVVSAAGASSFTVPPFNTIVFKLWGAGGGAGGAGQYVGEVGANGGETTITELSLWAGGGLGSVGIKHTYSITRRRAGLAALPLTGI
jgi:hypothetical protein